MKVYKICCIASAQSSAKLISHMGENKVTEDTVIKEESKSVAPYKSICCISHGHSNTRNLNFYILS
jgi:hypothetical protein